MDFDTVIINGLIVTASEILPEGLQIGIKDGKIASIGRKLLRSDSSARVIDAAGGYVTPGGIDSHVHIAQDNSPTGDTWETATRSAVAGGTTTVLAFASQKRHEESVLPAVKAYHEKANGQAHCDYGFHLIVSNVTTDILNNELPAVLSSEGITSVKLYMTYEPLKLTDKDLLHVMLACRKLGMTTMIHAENSDMISLVIEGLERNNRTEPFYHAIARPRIAEDEASYRAISLAELVDAPILIVHMSSEKAVQHVRDAQTRLLPIHAETCPHYLFLLSDELRSCHGHDQFHGARNICAPPLRHSISDLEALWRGIANGSFTVWSSDHAPHTYDHPLGKKIGLVNGIPRFSKVPNGVPGLETRLPLLFSQTTACLPSDKARLSLPQFVQLTAANAAKLYGLADRKGAITIGFDADITIWYPQGDPKGQVEIQQKHLHHGVDFTPFEGIKVQNWPRYTILRGEVVWDRDSAGIAGTKGFGQYLKRNKGQIVVGRLGQTAEGMSEGERDFWM
ncbi:unnamed protein product [Clonostachys rosea]|uniref:dihydropyrimidinase n=1 Tax=Bionectria ochroleuca TaxID=29856 RepID=A0ABY6UNE7_BIOOC|nr:unnamed protein product [Clonostachys rosea]